MELAMDYFTLVHIPVVQSAADANRLTTDLELVCGAHRLSMFHPSVRNYPRALPVVVYKLVPHENGFCISARQHRH